MTVREPSRQLRLVSLSDFRAYQRLRDTSEPGLDPMARMAVVIDEFATLVRTLPEFVDGLVGREPHGYGVRIVVAGVTTGQGVRESRTQGEVAQVSKVRLGRSQYARCDWKEYSRRLGSTSACVMNCAYQDGVPRSIRCSTIGSTARATLSRSVTSGLSISAATRVIRCASTGPTCRAMIVLISLSRC